MATFRTPVDWQALEEHAREHDDFWPTINAWHQAVWRARHPDQERAQQRLYSWKRRRWRQQVRVA